MKTSASDPPNGLAPTPRPRTPALVRRSVAALALGLAGCGGGSADGVPPQTVPPQAPPTPDVTAPQPQIVPPQAPPPPPQVDSTARPRRCRRRPTRVSSLPRVRSRILQRRGERRPPRSDSSLELAREWQLWIAENLLRGVAPDALIAGLVEDGVSPRRAESEVRALAASPAITAGRAAARAAQQLELVAAIGREMRALSADPRGVEAARAAERGGSSSERYFCASTPVLITDLMTGWPALDRWSPAYLDERLGDATIAVTTGRAADPDYDRNYAAHTETTTMARFADRVAAAGESNDFYMVSNNRNLEASALLPSSTTSRCRLTTSIPTDSRAASRSGLAPPAR